MYVCMLHVCMLHVCMYVTMYVCMYMYVCTCICTYVCKPSLCTCVYMCVFMIFSGIPTLFRPLESDVPLTDLALMFEGEGKDRKFNI